MRAAGRDLAAAVIGPLPPVLRGYLDHFGIPWRRAFRAGIADAPLIVVPPAPAQRPARGAGALLDAVAAGTGLVTFDPGWPLPARRARARAAASLSFTGAHWITAGRAEDELPLAEPLAPGVRLPGRALLMAGSLPLLTVHRHGRGRVVRWAGLEWADPAVLGPLGGLDGALWRSFAWAARKPFVLRGLPPLAAMRVDDVAGCGGLFGETPLYWAVEAVRLGFKPWLGIFTHSLAPHAIPELAPHLRARRMTAFPHALGRLGATSGPPLGWDASVVKPAGDGPDAYGRTDAFVYYDHAGRRAWPDREARARLDLAERWFRDRSLPMSEVFLPHWYEAGANVMPRVHGRWGLRLSCVVKEPDAPCGPGTPWLRGGPFRLGGPRGDATPPVRWTGPAGPRPVYYADFPSFGGRRFFNGATEIRDLAGYEWAPDADVPATTARGVRTIARALDSLALAVLFTHETDHLWRIPPGPLRRILRGVARGIAPRAPRHVTLEDGLKAVRATRTSRIASARFDPSSRRLGVAFRGFAGDPTSFMLVTDGPRVRHVPVPRFPRGRRISLRLSAAR